MELHTIPMPFILLALFLAVMITASFVASARAKAREAKYLTFDVDLPTRRDWNSFNPHSVFHKLTEDQLAQALALFNPDSLKDKLRIRWSYTTPSGRDHHQSELVYPVDDLLESKLKRAHSILKGGRSKLEALNSLYAESLKEDRQIDDDVPKIYGYRILGSKSHEGSVKVGYASRNAHKRIAQQFNTAARLDAAYEILFILPALTISGGSFRDHAVHRVLRNAGVPNTKGEWFECSPSVAESAVRTVQENAELPAR